MGMWKYPASSIWLHYADVFNLLGPMPINGSAYDADCAIGLAFGRNTYHDAYLHIVRAIRQVQSSDIAAMRRLHVERFNPGRPNQEIVRRGRQLLEWHDERKIPLIAQWEIGISLYQQRREAWVQDRFARQELFALWPPDRPAYRTIEVLEDAYRITQEHGWKRPVLLAHDCHMPRVAMLARHFWPEFIINFPSITSTFDAKSVQPMCASRRKWYDYECKARAHHLYYGWCFGHFEKGRF